MRKAFSILLILAITLHLCACCACFPSKTKTYAKVTYADGSTETLDAGKIPSLLRENQMAYNQKYAGNKVEVVDTVLSIGNGYGTPGYVSIDFSHDWNVFIKSSNPALVELREGMTVKITGTLQKNSRTIGNATITIID